MPVRQLIEFLTPTSCLGCASEGDLVCQTCLGNIPAPAAACFACGGLTSDQRACRACSGRYSLSGVVTGAHYEDPVRELILKLKFGRARAAVIPAAALLIRALPNEVTSRLSGVTAVPVAPTRRRERGYNQAELLAKEIAHQLAVSYRVTLRRQGVVHQLGAGRSDRFSQVEHAFEAITEVSGSWLLVDDVMTTGATLNACAAVLRAAGAGQVTGAVVAAQRG